MPRPLRFGGSVVAVVLAPIAPGDSDTLFLTASATPGDDDFVCTFPGHAESMKGILQVK